MNIMMAIEMAETRSCMKAVAEMTAIYVDSSEAELRGLSAKAVRTDIPDVAAGMAIEDIMVTIEEAAV